MNADVARAVLASILFLAAFLAVGGRVLQWAGVIRRSGDALRFLPIAMASGFAVYSYAAYPIVGLGTPAVAVWAALLGGVVLGRSNIAVVVTEARDAQRRVRERLTTLVPLAFLGASVGFLLLASTFWFTPPREGDALYGYMFNARWLYMQGFVLSPYNTVYNLYPFNTELVFALGFAIGNEIVAKVLDGVMGLVLLAAVYQTARSWASPRVSFFAAASLAVMNGFTTTWASGKIDVLCTLTFFAAVSLLILHREVHSRVLVVAAFLVGTSCAQKYTVWLFAVVFVCALPLLLAQPVRWRASIRQMALVGAVIALCLVPHFTKTLSWTGNPVAPFGGALFGSTTYLNPVDYSDAQTMSLADVPALPYFLFFSDSVRWPGPFPLLLLIGLPALAFVRVALTRRVALFAALLVGIWITARGDQWLVARFLLIPTALLLVVAAAGVSSLSQRSNLFRMAVTGLMLGLIVYSGIWQNRDWRRSWSYILGYEDRATWNDRVAPGRAYGALQAVSKLLGPERRFLLDASLYYIPPEKLPYTRTEREAMEFWALPESKQLEYLQKHCFGFVHFVGPVSDNPAWTRDLKVFAQLREPRGGTEYTIFEVDTHCGRSTALMSAARHAEQ